MNFSRAWRYIGSIALAGLISLPGYSATASFQVIGLFKDTAIVRLQNRETVLRVGMPANQGLRLISASSEQAVFEYQGRRFQHGLSDSPILARAASGASQEMRILPEHGMYILSGQINGYSQSFILDTGATYVTLSTRHADAMGINYLNQGRRTQLNTANGKADAYLVQLESVHAGNIEVKNVQAAILENLSTDKILLGMSFLNSVSMSNEGQVMLLQKKH